MSELSNIQDPPDGPESGNPHFTIDSMIRHPSYIAWIQEWEASGTPLTVAGQIREFTQFVSTREHARILPQVHGGKRP